MKSVPITTHLLTTLTNRMQQKLRINGEAVAASQEGTLAIEIFLNENYRFRRNVLNGKVELLTLPEGDGDKWHPLTQEALNSIILKAEREQIMEKGSPNAQIKMYVQSEEVPVFNPVAEFLNEFRPAGKMYRRVLAERARDLHEKTLRLADVGSPTAIEKASEWLRTAQISIE